MQPITHHSISINPNIYLTFFGFDSLTILKLVNSSLFMDLSLVNSQFVIVDFGLPSVDNHTFLEMLKKYYIEPSW